MKGTNLGEELGRRVASSSIRARWIVIAVTCLVSLGLGYGASSLQFAGDYRVFFGPKNPDFVANESAQGTFGKPDNLAFVVIASDGDVYDQRTLEAVHKLTDAAWRLPYVSRVDSLTNFQNTQGVEDDLIVEDLVPSPSELTPLLLAELRQTAESEPLLNGFVVSPDGGATIVNAVVQLPVDVPNASSLIAKQAGAIRNGILAVHPELEIHITGVAALSAAFEQAGLRDSSTLIPLVYLLILFVMFLTLRSLAAVFASLLLIALSTMVGVGVGGWTGVALTPISLSAPTIILTIAVADAIHLIAGIRSAMLDGANRHEAIVAATGLNFTPILVTSVTTIVGFLTLNFSDSPPFHHLGNMSAAGIAAAWLMSVTLLPALLSVLPLNFKAGEGRATVTTALVNTGSLIAKRPRAVLLSTLLATGAVIAAIPTMELNDQWSTYFSPSLEFRQAITATEPYFGSDQIEFVLDPGTTGGVTDPQFLRTVDEFAQFLRGQPGSVAHVFAISDIMKRVNRNMNGDDPSYYAIPESQTLASQYLLVYELSLPYGLDLNNRVDIDRRSTRITATMKDISTTETKAFLRRVQDWFAENGRGYNMDITGSMVLFSFVAERNIAAMFEGAVYLVLAIFVILAISFRSLIVGLISLLPNALPILATFGIWALLVGSVGFSIAAVGAVAVGLVVDFTVHFLSKYLRARRTAGMDPEHAVRYAFQTAGAAIFATTVILAAGFAILVTSSFKLNADLGLLTAIAVVLAMVINFLLLPSLFLSFGRSTVVQPTSPNPGTA
ncbi:MAG: MMPL family transporter [Pseudomonadota bacterium]